MAECVIENIMKRVAYGGCVDEFMQDEIAIHQTPAEGRVLRALERERVCRREPVHQSCEVGYCWCEAWR